MCLYNYTSAAESYLPKYYSQSESIIHHSDLWGPLSVQPQVLRWSAFSRLRYSFPLVKNVTYHRCPIRPRRRPALFEPSSRHRLLRGTDANQRSIHDGIEHLPYIPIGTSAPRLKVSECPRRTVAITLRKPTVSLPSTALSHSCE